MPSGFTVVFDSCVLHPASLRDLLLSLATKGLFRARWTADIHREWMNSVRSRYPDVDIAKLERTRELMDAHVLDSLVTGYEPLIEGLRLPDPNDRHVLAAAIRCGAGVIVTFNIRDFPTGVLDPLGVHAEHPDEFVMHLIDLDPSVFCEAAREHRARLRNPAKSVPEYLEGLRKCELRRTADALGRIGEPI